MKQFVTSMFLLCLTLSTSAFADGSCETQLTLRKTSTIEQNFNQVVDSLRTLGLKHLIAPLERGEVTVSFRSPRRWIPGLPLQAVRGKKTFFGKNKLIVRRLDLSSEKKTQQAMWEVALALYQMHVDKRLFAIRSMLPMANQRQFALTPDGEDEILAYFLHELPIEWRDERLVEARQNHEDEQDAEAHSQRHALTELLEVFCLAYERVSHSFRELDLAFEHRIDVLHDVAHSGAGRDVGRDLDVAPTVLAVNLGWTLGFDGLSDVAQPDQVSIDIGYEYLFEAGPKVALVFLHSNADIVFNPSFPELGRRHAFDLRTKLLSECNA